MGSRLRRPAQYAEETRDADRIVPKGFVIGAVMTSIMGWGYTLLLFYCIQACTWGCNL